MKKKFSVLLGAILVFLQANALHAQSFRLLHTFDTNSDGQYPDDLTLCGGTLYGTTFQGGDKDSGFDSGTIFSICTNGSNYTLLYSFSGPDGQNPTTMPVVCGGLIYGTTYGGNSNNTGLIYCIGTNGSNFSVLHRFVDGSNGYNPVGALLLVDGTLFGTTGHGLTNGGNLYSICTNGSNFAVLHIFDSGEMSSYGRLALSGGTLYGMTSTGGTNGYGFVYSIETNGTGFNILHQLTAAEGTAYFNPIVSGSSLFGCTAGGSSLNGTIFTIGTDGSNFQALHTFAGGSDGSDPHCTLTLSSNTLYGLATASDSPYLGTVFSINTDGSGYDVIYDFTDTNNGVNPIGTFVVSGSEVFGITMLGGADGEDIFGFAGYGTLFALTLPPAPLIPPFFTGEVALSVPGWYWLGPQGLDTYGFGYYSSEYAPYILHQDLGWEYFVDAGDANSGAYFYDFTDGVWFYTEPGVFPYLYDFNQNAWMYFAPQDGATDRYQSNPRWFYNTTTSQWVNDL